MGCSSSTEATAAPAEPAPAARSNGGNNANSSPKIPPPPEHGLTRKKTLGLDGDAAASASSATAKSESKSSHADSSSSGSSDTMVFGGTTDGANHETSSSNAHVTVGDATFRYASLSRRGRDPDDAAKPNQDRYGATTFSARGCTANDSGSGPAERATSAFFGVYDGHGPTGQLCSAFAQQRIPDLLSKDIKRTVGALSVNEIQHSIHEAHTITNDELHVSGVNDSYSGTTAVSLFVHPDDDDEHATSITISNVGDSRAVLGTAVAAAAEGGAGALKAVPLTKDQTPRRMDEAARCIKSGARILSFGQIDPNYAKVDNDVAGEYEEEVEDPPRIWSKTGLYPGTAFTRSIGDSIAEKLGVCAEPEMLTLKVSPGVKVVVLASDGVYDVLENQDVIDLCYRHRHDPEQACRAIIEKSHEEWLLNEDCTEDSASYDDMTIICIFIGDEVPAATTGDAPQEEPARPRHRKRVRQKTLRHLEEMGEEG